MSDLQGEIVKKAARIWGASWNRESALRLSARSRYSHFVRTVSVIQVRNFLFLSKIFLAKTQKLKIRLASFFCGLAPSRLCEKLWFTFHSWLRPRSRFASSVSFVTALKIKAAPGAHLECICNVRR